MKEKSAPRKYKRSSS